jgi:hypothetical protein
MRVSLEQQSLQRFPKPDILRNGQPIWQMSNRIHYSETGLLRVLLPF